MVAKSLYNSWQAASGAAVDSHSSLSPLLVILSSLGVAWLTWWAYTFTLRPALYPDEPKQVPYWIPFVGHVPSYTKNSNGTITYGREYFGNSREPFALTLMGETLYIITSPRDTMEVYKHTKTLSYDPFIQGVLENFGASPANVRKMFQRPQLPGISNPKDQTFIDLFHDKWKLQLYPGQLLQDIQKVFLSNIEESLEWDSFPKEATRSESPTVKQLSLFDLCGEVLLKAASRGLLGDHILTHAPDLIKHFYAFDRDNWKHVYKYPEIAAPDVYRAKRSGISSLQTYFALPASERSGISWIMNALDDGYRQLGLSEHENATMMWMMFWVSNSNAYKLSFWLLAHLVRNPELMAEIRAETRPAFTPQSTSGVLEMNYLEQSCPLLESAYSEVLRVYNEAVGARTVVEDTVVGGKKLRAGIKVLMPYRQLHIDPQAFGPDALEFQPRRFVDDKKLGKSTNYRPFGGGTTICPGRYIVKREVYLFVVLLLQRFELRLEGEQAFPEVDWASPTGGVMIPRKGDDLLVTVTRV